METLDLGKIVGIIKQVQNKHVRVCIWLDSDSNYKRQVLEWFENKKVMAVQADGYIPVLFGIPLFRSNDGMPPKLFNSDEYDLVYWFRDENILKISIPEVKKYLETQKEDIYS